MPARLISSLPKSVLLYFTGNHCLIDNSYSVDFFLSLIPNRNRVTFNRLTSS